MAEAQRLKQDDAALAGESGVLVVDKPPGPTSHDIVDRARALYGTRRVGHAGTLDPMATGVLVLMFGEALKLSGYLTADSKRYRAVVRFGRSTDTLDAAGRTTAEAPLDAGSVTPERLLEALRSERERTQQAPPTFSAIKVAGQRAYRAGRRGQTPELSVRAVTVHELELAAHDNDTATIELLVSKGYYVRALARDIGERLGLPAHLAELRRLASGRFAIDEAIRWPPESPVALLSTAAAAARAMPSLRLTPRGVERAALGQKLETDDFDDVHAAAEARDAPAVAWCDRDGGLVAIGRADAELFRVIRGFAGRGSDSADDQLADRETAGK